MTDRSSLREVRNPVLGLPSAKALMDLPDEAKAALADVLKDIAADAAQRAQKSWSQSKGPMAAYWKAVSVYAKHIRGVARA